MEDNGNFKTYEVLKFGTYGIVTRAEHNIMGQELNHQSGANANL